MPPYQTLEKAVLLQKNWFFYNFHASKSVAFMAVKSYNARSVRSFHGFCCFVLFYDGLFNPPAGTLS
jgi:hypothetical protein